MEKELVTIKDILDAVNKSNVNNFLIDFGMFLNARVALKEADIPVELEKFIWIDDGKHNASYKFTYEENK